MTDCTKEIKIMIKIKSRCPKNMKLTLVGIASALALALGLWSGGCAVAQHGAVAQHAAGAPPAGGPLDLRKDPTLYLVGYAHLDTEWRWEYPQVIQEYLAKTLLDNFALLEKYPHYVFNFTGAYRYKLFKEYYPEDYKKLQHYVAAGRWFPAGSSVDEGDVNSPNAESIIRQVLYGNGYFRHDFGKASAEYMLPDCFGFPASLPSILAHAGIKGFSTQKLSSNWQPAPVVGGTNSPEQTPPGIPFNVGIWVGTDGQSVIAALNPGSYGGSINSDLSKSPAARPPSATDLAVAPYARRGGPEDWPRRIQIDGEASGIFADFHYYGTGDTGGSPTPGSVRMMEAIVTKSKIVPSSAGRRGQPASRPRRSAGADGRWSGPRHFRQSGPNVFGHPGGQAGLLQISPLHRRLGTD